MITWNLFDTDSKNERAIFTRLITLTGPLERNGESLSSQPANQIFHFSEGYIFLRTRASVQSGSSNCTGLSILNVPRDNIKYPERPRPVSISTVYFYQSTGLAVLS